MTKWTIKSIYNANESYYSTKDDEKSNHQIVEEWTTCDFSKALEILKDFLDVPLAKVTVEQTKKMYNFPEITEEVAIGITNYYNGRLAIWEYAEKELKDHVASGMIDNVFCYDVPQKYASFAAFKDCQNEDVYLRIEVTCQNQ